MKLHRKTVFSLLKGITIITVSLLVLLYAVFELAFRGRPFGRAAMGNPPLTPAWALECWLWEDDANTSAAVDSLLAGYKKNDIPVRTILVDSPWSLRYNDFIVDTSRYPDPVNWFGRLEREGYRVVMWMTSMVNSRNDDTGIKEPGNWFRSASENSYLTGSGEQVNWWKGRGGFIDYSNPEALGWWHSLQQDVFRMGIDGWKLDGTATLFHTKWGPVPLPVMKTFSGLMTTRSYMDLYYRSEYQWGLEQNRDFITLVRSVDRNYHPEGFAPLDAAPVTWVGDQRHTWKHPAGSGIFGTGSDDNGKDGIELAMENIMKASDLGYNIIGSDVAGFSGSSIQPELYIRWAQFSAFCGLFLNGGHGERALWKRTPEELRIIRKFSWLHTELIPYIYSYVVTAHEGGTRLQRRVKGKYHYMFGDWLLVAPVYEDELKSRVVLPAGRWRYLFNDSVALDGPVEFEKSFPLDEYPVYVREGAVIPMAISRAYTGFGDCNSNGYLTLLVYPSGSSEFRVYHPDRSGSTLVSSSEDQDQVKISLSGLHKPHILSVYLDQAPDSVLLDGCRLGEPGEYSWDKERHKLTVKTGTYTGGSYVIFRQRQQPQ